MARNKETLVILLDVGPSMHQHLEYMSRAVSSLVHRKLLHNKFDEVGVAYFGADGTENALSESLSGYENIVVARQISVIADDLAELVHQLPRGTGSSDFLSAVVVGMDMIMTKTGAKSKGNKRICLITDAETLVKDSEEGTTKEEQVAKVAEQFEQNGLSMDAVVIRLGSSGSTIQSEASVENEFLLRKLASRTKGELILTESYTSLLGAIRTRQVSPTTLFRGELELTKGMSVKVWVYKKVSSERMPTMKPYVEAKAKDKDKDEIEDKDMKEESQLSVPSEPIVNDVQISTLYTNATDENIPPEQRVKAYRYGRQFIPISKMQEEHHKFKPEKGLRLMGFTNSSNIPRQYYMKEANVIVAEPGNARAVVAVSSLVRALAEAKKVAVVRCVWRANQSNVVLGVLTPNVSTDDDVADCFYFNILPFAEDLRDYFFRSFNDLPATLQPTSVQQEAADALVHMMDLAPPALEEMLKPERTVNPVLQRFYGLLHLKALDPDARLPAQDDALQRIMEPDQKLLRANEMKLQSFSQQFPLSQSIQKEKGRKYWQEGLEDREDDAPLQLGAGEDPQRQTEDQKPLSLEFLTNKKVEDVGSVKPIDDFEAMMARRDSGDWVPRAINGMKKIISDLLSSAYNGNTYGRAMDCLVALRAGCVMQEEPKDFNSYLREVAEKCRGKRLADFWEQIVAKNLTLISKEEAPDSEVTEDEATSFLSGQTNPSKVVKDEEVDEMDALFDDII